MIHTNSEIPRLLDRYTDRNELNSILIENQLRFSEWTHWNDDNDKSLLKLYMQKTGKSIFVYCTTMDSESIHHWSSFAKDVNGCRIKFNTEALFKYLNKNGISYNPVTYYRYNDLKKSNFSIENIPFVKRYPYRIESEFRLIKIDVLTTKYFSIKVGPEIIQEISLSPFASEEYNKEYLNNLIKTFPFLKNKIFLSKIFSYGNWINYFNRLSF